MYSKCHNGLSEARLRGHIRGTSVPANALGKSEMLWLHPKWMSSDLITEPYIVRSIGEVVLRCYNRTQTSFAQPTVSFYFVYLTLGISRTFLYLLASNLPERSRTFLLPVIFFGKISDV